MPFAGTRAEDSTTPVNLAALTDDVDGDALTYAITDALDNGTLTPTGIPGAGTFTYTPNANFVGTDSFTYTVTDPDGLADTATVTVTVTAVNDPPVAVADAYTTNEETPLTIAAPGVLGNDTDVDTAPASWTATVVTPPANGGVTLNPDGSFTYTPNANFAGIDTFTYTANDGALPSAVPATVTITVNAVNDAPVAVADAYTTDVNITLTVPAPGVLGNDTDVDTAPASWTATVVTPPASGGVTFEPRRLVHLHPEPGLHRHRRLLLHRQRRRPAQRPPRHRHHHRHRPGQRPPRRERRLLQPSSERHPHCCRAGVLANDTDADGTPLTAVVVAGPAHGTLTLNPDGSFTYTPTSSFVGSDTFTYRAFDGVLNSTPATVTITDNVAPIAVDVQATNTSGQNESRLDTGDTIVFTFSEPIDPTSIIAGWNGTGSQNVVIRLSDTQLLEDDEILVYDATNSFGLPLGVVDLDRTDYVVALFGEGNVTYGAPGTATPSTMTISGNTVTIVLGTYTEPGGGQGNRETAAGREACFGSLQRG